MKFGGFVKWVQFLIRNLANFWESNLHHNVEFKFEFEIKKERKSLKAVFVLENVRKKKIENFNCCV